MNQHYDVTAISADEKELQQVAAKYGVHHHHVEMTRTISPLQDLAAVWDLYRFLKKEKPEIVHSHTPKAGIIGMMAAFFAGVPHRFHTVAGLPLLEATGLKRLVLDFVEKLTYSFATRVYPNSFGLKKIIIEEKFCYPNKLKVIANGSSTGIDTAYFDRSHFGALENSNLKTKLNITPEDFVFIFVGRLVGDKGINELVAAFKTMEEKIGHQERVKRERLSNTAATPQSGSYSNTLTPKLLLVGSFETALDALKAETLQEIEQNPNIITVGFQPDVRPYFAISDTLVFPSYREGFPNVVLQAGSMGLPSIVTDINGCNEIIKNHQNGLVIPVKDDVALEKVMRQVVEDDILHRSLQHEARKKIVNSYEQEMVLQAILAEYKKETKHV